MPIIRASCSACGDVEILPADMRIFVCSTNGESTYSFICPACGIVVRRAVDKRIVEVLARTGVRLHFWTLPEELFEHGEGPPIDYDDILNFHYALSGHDWVRELQGSD